MSKITKRRKNPLKKIDGMEWSLWIIMTLIYTVFVMILSGWVKITFDDIKMVGSIPLDLNYGVWVLGIALWVPMSLWIKNRFERT